VKNKSEGGIIVIDAPQVPLPWQVSAQALGELNGITPKTFKKSVEGIQIGEDYLIDREKIEKEYRRRHRQLVSIAEPQTFREPKSRV